jgi:hypothetical protein
LKFKNLRETIVRAIDNRLIALPEVIF